MAANAYKYTNSKGQDYFLHAKDVTLKNGRVQRIYFFAREIKAEGALAEIPAGKAVMETARTSMPVLKNADK